MSDPPARRERRPGRREGGSGVEAATGEIEGYAHAGSHYGTAYGNHVRDDERRRKRSDYEHPACRWSHDRHGGQRCSAATEAERIHATVIARPCLSDYLSAHRRVLPIEDRAGHCTAQISWRYAGGDLLAQFTEDVPRRPGVSITTDMALDYPKDPNWVTVILREAGPPSATDGKRPWSSALWCLGFVCDMKHTMSDPNSSLWLSVDRCCGFNLDDAVAATRREAAIRKQLHAHGIVLVP